MLESKILMKVRDLFRPFYAAGDESQQPQMTNAGEQIVVQGLPPDAALVALGETYSAMMTTAIAALTATPTTVAMLTLFNGEADGGKSYSVDSVLVEASAVGTTMMTASLYGMVNKARKAIPTAGLTPNSMSGRLNYRGKGVVATGLTVTNDVWVPIGTPVAGGTTNALPYNVDTPIKGMIIIPPGGMFNVSVRAAVTTNTYNCGFRWHEVQLSLG